MRSQLSQARGTHLLMVAVALAAVPTVTAGCSPPEVSPSQPSASVPATPFVPTSWELRPIILPAGHENGVIHDVSADGSVIVFRDADAYDPLYVAVGSQVRELIPPGHEQGAPIGSQMFSDGRRLLVGELARAWIYDIATGRFEPVPDPPVGGLGIYVLADDRMVTLTGSVASHEFGGVTASKLWLLDPTTMIYTELGTRKDGISMLLMWDAVALIVDRSPDHDNSQWAWFRVGFDGVDSLMYEFDGAPASFALALDGKHLAFTKVIDGQAGTWLVGLATGAERRVSDGGVISFSPDGQLLAIYFPDGHTEAVKLDGTKVTSVASNQVGWIGVP